MESSDKVLLWVAVGLGAYILYQHFKKTPQPVVNQSFKNAGATTWKGTYNPSSVMVNVDPLFSKSTTTYKFSPGDYDRLNTAQRTLINLDAIVPGTWLTRLALNPWRD